MSADVEKMQSYVSVKGNANVKKAVLQVCRK